MARRHKYGLYWPDSWSDPQIELTCWKKWREFPGAALKSPVEEHLFEACHLLFTPQQLAFSPWFEKQAHAWTYDDFFIFWGSAGSGKSHSLGLFTLLDFLADPDCTFAMLASTTKEMLAYRSFASVVQYLTYLRGNRTFSVPFRFAPSKMAVVPESASDDDLANLKHVIKGVAVQAGSENDAKTALQGVHTRYVRFVLDELSAMKPAAMAARHNLAQCFSFKLAAAANPESFNDECGKYSVPKTGWTSVSVDTDEWETPWGKVYRFDAFKSPGLKEPDRLSFLPTQASIARIIKENNGNEDAPAVWTMLRAFPPPQGADRTVLTDAILQTYKAQEQATFASSFVPVAALDPAFTADGDGCIYQAAKVGVTSEGRMTIVYGRTVPLEIKASDPRPVLSQIGEQAVALAMEDGVQPRHFGVDDSGTQSVADEISRRMRAPVFRFNYGEKPPDVAVSVVNPTLASKKYRNMITFLYYAVREYCERGQIRGLPADAARQLCLRRVSSKLQVLQLESKAEHKKRLRGKSPDEGDAAVMCAGVARLVLGLAPGATEWTPAGEAAPDVWDDSLDGLADKYNNMPTSYAPSEEMQNNVDGPVSEV